MWHRCLVLLVNSNLLGLGPSSMELSMILEEYDRVQDSIKILKPTRTIPNSAHFKSQPNKLLHKVFNQDTSSFLISRGVIPHLLIYICCNTPGGLQLPTSKGCIQGALVPSANSVISTDFCIDHQHLSVPHHILCIKLHGRLSAINPLVCVYQPTSTFRTPPAITHHTHTSCNH